jgi:hypothetical protein
MTAHLSDDQAVELALGLVAGPERADALTHLSGCVACRAAVDELARAVDALLVLTPASEPPAGFEDRVLSGMRDVPARREPRKGRRRLRVAVLAAGLAVAVGAGVAGTAVLTAAGPVVEHAAMTTPDGVDVGTVFVHDGEPSWVLLSLPGWEGWDMSGYRVSLEYSDGEMRSLPLAGGNSGTWAVTTSLNLDGVARLAVLGYDEREFCAATF